jgi:hypothetical protein
VAKAVILIILWATVIWRIPAIKRSARTRSLWLALACLALALTYDLPFVIRALDRVSGVTDLATVVKHVLGVAACANLLDWIVASVEPEHEPWYVRRRRPIAAATALALIVLFFLTPRVETVDFAASAAGNSWAIAYLVVFELYLGFAMALACGMFVTAWGDARPGFLRTGFALLVAGTAAGIAYALARSAALAVSLVTGSMPDGNTSTTSLTDTVQVVAIALILLGLAVPACEAGWKRAHTIRALIDLRPLWHEVTCAIPSMRRHERPTLREDLTALETRRRLVRRMTDIRDSTVQLRGHVTDQHWRLIQQRLDEAGMTGREKDVTAEACWIGAAILLKAQQTPNPDPVMAPSTPDIPAAGGFNLDQDLNWLRAVAKARRSALVTEIEEHIARIHPATATLRENPA